jgi:hypothetical protein
MGFATAYERLTSLAPVCKQWLAACRAPQLCLWVDGATDHAMRVSALEAAASAVPAVEAAYPRDDWFTIGSWVEALYANGEVWYPCMVSDAHQDGTYSVTYTDSYVENGLRRSTAPSTNTTRVGSAAGPRRRIRGASRRCRPPSPQPPMATFSSFDRAYTSVAL